MDNDQKRRERAYRIWEAEGRPDCKHEDHWQRAEEQHEKTEGQAEEVTQTNQDASDEFNGEMDKRKSRTSRRPPSSISPD